MQVLEERCKVLVQALSAVLHGGRMSKNMQTHMVQVSEVACT